MRAFLVSVTNRVPSIYRTGSLFPFRRFGRNWPHGAIQINSCQLCLVLILIFCPRTVCGNIAPLSLNDGTCEQADPTSCTRKGCWNHGRCEMRSGKKESLRCFMKIGICAAQRASVRCAKRKRNRSARTECAIRFASFLMALICLIGARRRRRNLRYLLKTEKFSFTWADFIRRKTWRI